MKRLSLFALALVAPMVALGDTVFSDTFGSGSTINGTPFSPTANSAAYQNWSQGANPAGFSIGPNALHFAGRTTTSVFAEVQAAFAATPVTLNTVGDYIDLNLVFTDTLNILLAGQNSSSQITIGLFNSGATLPLTGARLDAAGFPTGGTAGYVGYIGRVMLNGNASVITRPVQSGGANSSDQDLLFNNAGGGAFNSPTGASVGATATSFTGGLTQGSQYSLDYRITLNAANTLTISESIYDSVNTLLMSQSQVASGGTFLTSSFDALAFGWRRSGPDSQGSSVNVNSILVTDYIQTIPEPGSLVMLCGGLGLLAFIRRFRG